MSGDIYFQVLQDKSLSLTTLQSGSLKISGQISIDNSMVLANYNLLRESKNISWSIMINGEFYLTVPHLIEKNYLLLMTNQLTSFKKLLLLNLFDQIKSFQLYKILSLKLWEKNSLLLQPLICLNAIETLQYLLR